MPTPIPLDGKLLISTENNGTRLYDFDEQGKIKSTPLAVNRRLTPDTHTPVVTAGRVFGVWRRLYCLDLGSKLKELWTGEDAAFAKYGAIVADADRVLFIAMNGELLLIDAKADEYKPLARMIAIENESGLYSHPAFVGDRLYLRGSTILAALRV